MKKHKTIWHLKNKREVDGWLPVYLLYETPYTYQMSNHVIQITSKSSKHPYQRLFWPAENYYFRLPKYLICLRFSLCEFPAPHF
jgi:hypothetical protein